MGLINLANNGVPTMPQFMMVLERLTLALEAPGQGIALPGDPDSLIEGLERLVLALKSSDHKTIAGETESVPADSDTEDDDSD